MGISISIEVSVPETADKDEIIRVGSACYPHSGLAEEPMTLPEALQWAFQSGGWAIQKLLDLGVTWDAQHQARLN